MKLRKVLKRNILTLKRKENNMKPEYKELQLKDLCARLSYRVHIWTNDKKHLKLWDIEQDDNDVYWVNGVYEVDEVKPYLRPMSSMTNKEYEHTKNMSPLDYIDWLNAHHFDYRGLIDKGLAIEVTEENNPYKDKD